MSTKRVNLTLNVNNPMDSLIIQLLGGEDYLTSKNIKGLLLQMAIKNDNDTFIPQKRNVYDTTKKQSSNFKVTQKKLKSDNKGTNKEQKSVKEVSKIEQDSIDNVTQDFDLDNIITYKEPEEKEENKVLADEDIYMSMLNFM